MRRALLIFNPKSGDGENSLEKLLKRLGKAGFKVDQHIKGEPGLDEALAAERELIIVAGGDGTVHKLIQNLDHIHAPLAILPYGTANNIARSLGGEGDPKQLIARLADAAPGRIDLGTASGPWGARAFIEAVGIGVIAELTGRSFQGNSPDEKLDLIHATLAEMIEIALPIETKVEIDGEPLTGDHLFVEATSLRRVGPGLLLAPHADAGDRQLDVLTLPVDRRDAMASWLRGGAVGHPPVNTRRAREVTFDWQDGPLRIDAKVMRPEKKAPGRVHVELRPEGLPVLVPSV